MKRIICLLLCLCFVLCLCGCGNKEENVIEGTAKKSGNAVTVDLSKMSTTMVYSELTNILNAPNDYIGKTIRLKGLFGVSEGEGTNYYFCLINDATACCQQGLEFVLEGNPAYPEGYPQVNSEITVEGTFNTYKENETQYCHLENAKIL